MYVRLHSVQKKFGFDRVANVLVYNLTLNIERQEGKEAITSMREIVSKSDERLHNRGGYRWFMITPIATPRFYRRIIHFQAFDIRRPRRNPRGTLPWNVTVVTTPVIDVRLTITKLINSLLSSRATIVNVRKTIASAVINSRLQPATTPLKIMPISTVAREMFIYFVTLLRSSESFPHLYWIHWIVGM